MNFMKKLLLILLVGGLAYGSKAQNILESGDLCAGTLVLNLNINDATNIQWSKNGEILPNENKSTLTINVYGSGEYIVSYSNQGNSYADSKIIEQLGPVADYTFEKYLPAGGIQCTDRSDSGQKKIETWQWDIGQDPILTEQNPFIMFPDEGIYMVTLRVTDEDGCVGIITKEIEWSYDQ